MLLRSFTRHPIGASLLGRGKFRAWLPRKFSSSVISFSNVSYEYEYHKPILEEAYFSISQGSKVTLMGQNGSGKSTIFKLINRVIQPEDGGVHVVPNTIVATALQVMPAAMKNLKVEDFFRRFYRDAGDGKGFHTAVAEALKVVALDAPRERTIASFSGGQQARLLLASCLVQAPDVLLLDEPTNNLDHAAVERLQGFIQNSPKTVLVISHDADFLNSFSEAVLYLDRNTKRVESYSGNYFDVQEQIARRIERENRINAQQQKLAKAKKDQMNRFAMKGGKMRLVAKRMKDAAARAEGDMVEVRKEDLAIKPFRIPAQPSFPKGAQVLRLDSVSIRNPQKGFSKTKMPIKPGLVLKKGQKLRLAGPNGVGKTTLLEALASGLAEGASIADAAEIGYYRQDFSSLNFDHTVLRCLSEYEGDEQRVRSVASSFHLTSKHMGSKVGTLSEGQKGLVAFARLVLQRPALLILDEPTNHINFRHLPVISKALDAFEGAMIIVSHDPHFCKQIEMDHTIDLGDGLQ